MSKRSAFFLLSCSSLCGALAACFSGAATLGGYCETDAQCGGEQTCVSQTCGLCGNEMFDAGELCLGASDDVTLPVMVEASDMIGESVEVRLSGISVGTMVGIPLALLDPLFGDARGAVAGYNAQCTNVDTMETTPCFGAALIVSPDGEVLASPLIPPLLGGSVDQISSANIDGNEEPDVVASIGGIIPALLISTDLFSDEEPLFIPLGDPAVSLVTGDLDGDGLDDVLSAGEADPILNWFPSAVGPLGDTRVDIELAFADVRIANPADMNGDGRADIIYASASEDAVRVHLADGEGGFPIGEGATTTPGGGAARVLAVDYDLDEALDVIVVESQTDSLTLLRGDGDGGLERDQVLDTFRQPTEIVVDDVNGDELPDLLVAGFGDDQIAVFINRGEGRFPDRVAIDVSASPRALVRDDFDGDGRNDLAVGSANGIVSLVLTDN